MSAGGLAANSDIVRVAAKIGDVVVHPVQRELLIEEAIIGKEVTFVI